MTDRSGIFAGDHPFDIVRAWMTEASATEVNDPNAMTIATVDKSGMPNVRVVLLKEIDDSGFVFFTNYNSQKAQEIEANGKAALNLFWKSLGRQIRVRGTIRKVSAADSDTYYLSRPLGSKIGAWASQQSEELSSKEELVSAVRAAETKFGDGPPRPDNWGGYTLVPKEIEFWANGEYRLHDRFKWQREDLRDDWRISRLYP